MSSTANRIIKNTGYLYAKMAVTMFVSLYTTRLILNSLGASDFGIYNIVGGAISMLGFFSASMASATQRFISYAEGEGNSSKKNQIFNVSVVLHFALALFVVCFLLIAGYFFFHFLLKIPNDRIFAAKVVYGCLIISSFFTVMSAPYDAVMNAHENMLYFSIIGILESVLKLIVAFICIYTVYDRLVVYGVLMSIIPILILLILRLYCHMNYSECKLAVLKKWNGKLAKEIGGFAFWNFFSSVSSMLTMQGVGIVLNYFWGVLANAAQGVANQLSGQIMVFSNNMLKALDPVIVKSEGASNRQKMLEAAMCGNKFSFLMMTFFAIPFCIEMPYILRLWLKTPPEHVTVFCRLILIRLSITQLTITFNSALGATGKIKKLSFTTSVIMISVLPIACLVYYLGGPIYSIYVIYIYMVIALMFSNLYFMKDICGLKLISFFYKVLIPCCIVSSVSFVFGIIPMFFMETSLLRLISVMGFSMCSYILVFYHFGMNNSERSIVQSIIKKVWAR